MNWLDSMGDFKIQTWIWYTWTHSKLQRTLTSRVGMQKWQGVGLMYHKRLLQWCPSALLDWWESPNRSVQLSAVQRSSWPHSQAATKPFGLGWMGRNALAFHRLENEFQLELLGHTPCWWWGYLSTSARKKKWKLH